MHLLGNYLLYLQQQDAVGGTQYEGGLIDELSVVLTSIEVY